MHMKEFGTSFDLAETAILQEIKSHLLPEWQNSQFGLVAERDKTNLYCKDGFLQSSSSRVTNTPRSMRIRINSFAVHPLSEAEQSLCTKICLT